MTLPSIDFDKDFYQTEKQCQWFVDCKTLSERMCKGRWQRFFNKTSKMTTYRRFHEHTLEESLDKCQMYFF